MRQRTLLNLGAHFAIKKAHWGGLCQCVDQRLRGQSGLGLAPVPAAVEAKAQRIAAQRLGRPQPASSASDAMQSVDVDSLTWVRPRSVAVEQLGWWAMAQVDFTGLRAGCGFNGPQPSGGAGHDHRPPGRAGLGAGNVASAAPGASCSITTA